jgi:site-specific recombinase XerD
MITFEEGLQAYRIFAQASGHSKRTIQWITSSVRYFAESLGDKHDVLKVTANDLRRFVISWGQRPKFTEHPYTKAQNENISPVSVQTYARGVRAFFGHLADEEIIPANPMQKVKIPKVTVKSVPTHNVDEVSQLLRMPDKNTPTGFRDFAIMLTILDTHGRLSEICNISCDGINLEAGTLRLMGKGSKERFVPIGAKTCRAILKYKVKYRPQPIGANAFWLTEDGNKISPNRIEVLISKYGEKAGLGRCYPHKLRHTASVLYLRNGGDPFSLQKILGHSSLQMTRHYCNLADTDVKQQHLKFGVGDRLKI